MKLICYFLCAALTACVTPAWAQSVNVDVLRLNLTGLPTYCSNGDIRNDLTGLTQICSSNAWSVVGSSTAGTFTTGNVRTGSGSALLPSYAFQGDFDTGVFADMGNTVAVSTGGAERLRVTNVGLGIGTNSPGSPLHVVGLATLGSLTAGNITGLEGGTFAGALSAGTFVGNGALLINLGGIAAGSITSGTLSPLRGGTGAGSFAQGSVVFTGAAGAYSQDNTNLTFNDSTDILSVSHVAAGTVSVGTGSQGAPTYSFTGDRDTGWLSPLANTMVAATFGAEALRIDATGNVGIAQTNPTSKLHVNGTVTAGTFSGNGSLLTSVPLPTGGTLSAGTGNAAAPSYSFLGDTDTGMSDVQPDILALNTASTERLRINAGGAVTIGTNNANASALLQLQSTNRGFMPPVMTASQGSAIASPATGLMIYDSSNNGIKTYNGTVWDDKPVTPWLVRGKITGASPSLNINPVSVGTDISHASLTLTPLTTGTSGGVTLPSFAVGAVCSGTFAPTAPSTGATTCAGGNEVLGFNTTIPGPGLYEVCAEFQTGAFGDSAEGVHATFEWVETVTNGITALQNGGQKADVGVLFLSIATGVDAEQYVPVHLCGYFYYPATPPQARVFRILYEESQTGSPDGFIIVADADANNNLRDFQFVMRRIP